MEVATLLHKLQRMLTGTSLCVMEVIKAPEDSFPAQ